MSIYPSLNITEVNNSALEEGEIVNQISLIDQSNFDNSQMQQLTDKFQNLNETTAQDPNHQNQKQTDFKGNPLDRYYHYAKASQPRDVTTQGFKPDQSMRMDDGFANRLDDNDNEFGEANVIGNEESHYGFGEFDDKNDDSADHFNQSAIQGTTNSNGTGGMITGNQKRNLPVYAPINNQVHFRDEYNSFMKDKESMQLLLEEQKQPNQSNHSNNNNSNQRAPANRQSNFNANNRSQGQPNPNYQTIATQDFAKLMKSKKEIYDVLTSQGQYYLPPYPECTLEYLKGVFSGDKKVLLNHEVRIINVPKLNELTVISLIEQVKHDQHVSSYLPDMKDKRSVNRQFLYNIINTVKPHFFPENIRASLEKRKELRTVGKEKVIRISNEMYNLFNNAINLNPSQRGRAFQMLGIGTKKRKRPDRPENQFKQPKFNLLEFTPGLFDPNQMTQQSKRYKSNNFSSQGGGTAGMMIKSSVQANPVGSNTQSMSMIQPQTQNQK